MKNNPDAVQQNETENSVAICYCGNKKIFGGLLLSALSVARQTKARLEIIVLSMSLPHLNENYKCISENQINVLQNAIRAYNPRSIVRLIDVTQLYCDKLYSVKNKKNSYTPYASIRLLLDLLTDIPPKLIYLDIDTMATDDITKLYGIDMTDYEFGAVHDYMGTFWISSDYCNSGVLLLNIQKIKQTGLFEKCRQKIIKQKMIMPDQTALNKLAVSKLYLPRRFNEQRERREDTVIKHFCKGIRYFPFFHIYNVKQWQRDKVRKTLKIDWLEDTYREYDEILENNDIDI